MLCFSSVQGHARKYVWTKRKSRLTVGHRASSVHVPITHVVSFTRSVVFEKQDYLLPLLTGTSIDVIVWGMRMSTICWLHRQICTTKIDGVAHRPRIASTMIKLISKPILLPFFFKLILVNTIQRFVADPKRKLSPPFDLADSVPSLGQTHPAPGSGKMLSLFTVLCDYSIWVTETGAPGSGKTIQPIII